MSERQIRQSKKIIREAWLHRHTHPHRAHIMIRCNIAAIRKARAVAS